MEKNLKELYFSLLPEDQGDLAYKATREISWAKIYIISFFT